MDSLCHDELLLARETGAMILMQFPHRFLTLALILVVAELDRPKPAIGEQDSSKYIAQAIGKVAASVRQASDSTEIGYNEGLSLSK